MSSSSWSPPHRAKKICFTLLHSAFYGNFHGCRLGLILAIYMAKARCLQNGNTYKWHHDEAEKFPELHACNSLIKSVIESFPPFHCHCVLEVSYSRRSIRRTFDFLSPMLSGTTHHHPSRQFNLGYSPVVKVSKTLGEVGKVSKPRPFYFSHLFLLLFLASSMADSFLYTYHICMDICTFTIRI